MGVQLVDQILAALDEQTVTVPGAAAAETVLPRLADSLRDLVGAENVVRPARGCVTVLVEDADESITSADVEALESASCGDRRKSRPVDGIFGTHTVLLMSCQTPSSASLTTSRTGS
jgi:hypothetical protein